MSTLYMDRLARFAVELGIGIRKDHFNAVGRETRDENKTTDTDKLTDAQIIAALQAVAKRSPQHFHNGSTPTTPDHGKSLNERGMEKLDAANAQAAVRESNRERSAVEKHMQSWAESNRARLEKCSPAMRLDFYETERHAFLSRHRT